VLHQALILRVGGLERTLALTLEALEGLGVGGDGRLGLRLEGLDHEPALLPLPLRGLLELPDESPRLFPLFHQLLVRLPLRLDHDADRVRRRPLDGVRIGLPLFAELLECLAL